MLTVNNSNEETGELKVRTIHLQRVSMLSMDGNVEVAQIRFQIVDGFLEVWSPWLPLVEADKLYCAVASTLRGNNNVVYGYKGPAAEPPEDRA